MQEQADTGGSRAGAAAVAAVSDLRRELSSLRAKPVWGPAFDDVRGRVAALEARDGAVARDLAAAELRREASDMRDRPLVASLAAGLEDARARIAAVELQGVCHEPPPPPVGSRCRRRRCRRGVSRTPSGVSLRIGCIEC